ncbi:MAG: energy-coupling factor transporter transmembrane protein EcfT [Actinomycetota bacterium]|nr:energy-coupling factor transporter transmembrane protein EcfT [Actinomycetota bacterium]
MTVHPAAWVVWTLCGGLVALATTNPFYLLLVFAGAWVVHAAHRHPGPGIRSFWIFASFGLLTIVTRTALVLLGPVSRGSVVAAMLEGARLAVMLVVYGTFNSVSDPWRLLRLAPRRFHEPALASVLALSIAPRMIDAGVRVREAQRLRGIHAGRLRNLPALAVPVLSTGMEEAVTLAESMDARGHGRGRRSRYRSDPWNVPSWLTVVAGIIPLAYVAMMLWSGSQLAMPAYPLDWPEVSPGAVTALIALALPALVPPADPTEPT